MEGPSVLYHDVRGLELIHEYETDLVELDADQILTGNDLYMAVRRRIILTGRARKYQDNVEPWIARLPSSVILRAKSCVAIFQYFIPAAKLEHSPGEVREGMYDLTNLTKPTEDIVFRKMGIDDALTTTKVEVKTVSEDDKFRLRVLVHIYGE